MKSLVLSFLVFLIVGVLPGTAKAESGSNSFGYTNSFGTPTLELPTITPSSFGTPTLELPTITPSDALTALYLGFGSVDLLSSLNIALRPLSESELNPLLGAHPSVFSYAMYLPFAFGASIGIAKALYPRDRNTLLLLASTVEVDSVITNLSAGLTPILYALPTILVGVGVGIITGIVCYYIAHEVLKELGYYNHPPKPFASRPWPLKGESRA